MILDLAAREFAHWDYATNFDPTSLAIWVRIQGAWYPVESKTVLPPDAEDPRWHGTIRLLVAGPDISGNPAGTVTLDLGKHFTEVRLVDEVETVIRDGGAIWVIQTPA